MREYKKFQHTERVSCSDLDFILGNPFYVLDGQGFVRPVDYMGGEDSIVRAARVSYGKGTKTVREDTHLIRYLLRKGHSSPFEMATITFHMRLPMDVMRQLVRHRTASLNEYSTRYSEAIDDNHIPSEFRIQSKKNKQGSDGVLDDSSLIKGFKKAVDVCRRQYNKLLKKGVAREQARSVLNLCSFTEIYWEMDLRNIFHFLKLRLDKHAQQEIREYAEAIAEVVNIWCPNAYEAFSDYQLYSMSLSSFDQRIIKLVTSVPRGNGSKILEVFRESPSDFLSRNSRERRELEEKMRSLGIFIPWMWNEVTNKLVILS